MKYLGEEHSKLKSSKVGKMLGIFKNQQVGLWSLGGANGMGTILLGG